MQERFLTQEGQLEIKGKAAVATGASSDDGIGAECAKILARAAATWW